MGEWMYRSIYFLSQHWLGVSGQLYAPATLTLGKDPLIPFG
jgi:hypothetical protein